MTNAAAQDDPQQDQPKVVAQRSRKFILQESGYPQRDDSGFWKFANVAYQTSNKIVWVYRRPAFSADGFMFVAELDIAQDCSITVSATGDHQVRPAGSDAITVPYMILGQEYEYVFVATRAYLDEDQRGHIENILASTHCVPRWRFTDQPAATIPPNIVYGPLAKKGKSQASSDEVFFVSVLDPMSVASTLHKGYITCCDRLRAFTCPADDTPVKDKASCDEVAVRNKYLLLASLIKGVVDAGDKPEIKKCLDEMVPIQDSVLGTMNGYDGVYYKITRKRDALQWAVNYNGALVGDWLHSDLYEALKSAYDTKLSDKDFADAYAYFMNHRASCEVRLCESATGLNYLNQCVERDEQYARFVLSEGRATKEQYELVEKFKGFVTSTWAGTIPVVFRLAKKKGQVRVVPEKLLKRLTRWTDMDPTVDLKELKLVKRELRLPSAIPGDNPRIVPIEAFNLTDEEAESLKGWFENSVHGVTAAFAAITLATAICEWATAEPSENGAKERYSAMLSIAGSVGELSELLSNALKWKKRAFAAGIFVAVATVVSSILELKENVEYDNFGGVVGDGIQALGGMLSGWAAWLELAGAQEESTGLLTTPGVISTIAGAFCFAGAEIASIFHTSDLQDCVRFSCFGKNHDNDVERKPKWAPAAFKEWKDGEDGLDYQTTALINLLSAFSLCAQEQRRVRIFPGVLSPGSRFSFTFTGTFSAKSFTQGDHQSCSKTATCVYDCDTKTLVWTGGDQVNQTAAQQGEEDGRPYFDVTFEPIFADGDGTDTYETGCRACLQLDTHTRLPSTDPYTYSIYELGRRGGWGNYNEELSIWDDEPAEQHDPAMPSTKV